MLPIAMINNSSNRAVVYTRSSRLDIKQGKPNSAEQKAACDRFISNHPEWEASPNYFYDDDASGATPDRYGYSAMKVGAMDQDFSVVVVYSLDRLATKPGLLGYMLLAFNVLGVRVFSLEHNRFVDVTEYMSPAKARSHLMSKMASWL